MNKSNSSISFDNYGRVISLNASAGGSQAIDWNAITTGSNTLHNYPTGLIEAFEADGVRPGVNGSVINDGTIKAITSTASSSDGVDGQTNSGLVINNNGNGLIEGGRHGITADAADETVSFTLSVTNQHNATIHGDISGGSGTNTCTIDPGLIGFFTYRGSISDFDSVEIKSGIVSFLGASSYAGTTTVSGGIFIVANNTGSGAVQVTRGTLGGNGSIGGGVTIGGGTGPAVLAPAALPTNEPTLTMQSTLTFQTRGTYLYTFAATRNNSRADEVIANGVTIGGGATLTVGGIILGRLPIGTTFTVINNTAATPIAGTFANLHDGSIITIFGNHLQASYEGGDGNDLTLTVVR